MLQKLFKSKISQNEDTSVVIEDKKTYRNWSMLLVLPAWVFVSFVSADLIIVGISKLLSIFNITFSTIDKDVLNAITAAILYILTLFIVVGVPYIFKKNKTTRAEIGLTRLPSWTDIFITPAGLIIYFIISSLLTLLATNIFPWFDVNQVQNTGFSQLNNRFEYFAAFITLVVVAPIAEESLFRGYLYGKLKKYVPVWAAILVTSALFGALHGAWNLAIDTFALSVISCLLRESTKSLNASILLHMIKNGIAFYLLFINPLILTTLGG